jgi:hypothetical protein
MLDAIEAQNRRKIQIEQATINSARATAMLVDVAQKQESAMESVVDLVGALVENQVTSDAANRKRFLIMVAIAGVSAIAGVTGVILNWLH